MALARCLSINFSSISSNCFSALSGLSGLLGGCLKHRKPSDIALKFQIDSSDGDEVYAANDVLGTNSSDSPTLLVPGSFFSSTPNLEDQNSGPTWINPVMVEYPQSVNLTKEPDKADTSQNLTTYNAPVRINSKENDCGHIEIQSIPVQKTDEKMDYLAKSHMKKFSELMSSVEEDAGYEPRLLTPMRQVDKSPSNDDSKYEAMDPIFTPIDVKNFLVEGVVLKMPIRIEEGVLGGVNIPDNTLSSRMPAPTEEEVLGGDLYDSRRSAPKVLPFRIVSQERENQGIILPVGGLYSSTEGSFPASLEQPLLELSSLDPIQPVLVTLTSKQDTLSDSSDEFSGDEDFDDKVPSVEIYLNANARLMPKPVNARIRRKLVIFPEDDERFKAKSIETAGEVNREENLEVNYKRTMTDVEYKNWVKNWENMEKKMNEESLSNVFEQFFADIVTQTNPDTFFKTLNQYVSSIKNGIKEIFPSPAPASPRVEPDNKSRGKE